MARKIVFTSGKGGVGKTTICANLGISLSQLGFRVILVDVDIGLNNLDIVLGIDKHIVFDIADVIAGKCRPKQALVQEPRYPNLYILPSSKDIKDNRILSENIRNVINMLDASFDYILIDCPAGVDEGFHRAVFSADEAVVIVTPHLSSIRDANKVIGLLNDYDISSKSLIINRMRGDMLVSGEMLTVENIVRSLKIPLLGVVPEDDEISSSCSTGSIIRSGESVRAFSLLTENLHEGTRKIFDCTYKYRGFMGYVRRQLKRKV